MKIKFHHHHHQRHPMFAITWQRGASVDPPYPTYKPFGARMSTRPLAAPGDHCTAGRLGTLSASQLPTADPPF